jgi:hypothetical protein
MKQKAPLDFEGLLMQPFMTFFLKAASERRNLKASCTTGNIQITPYKCALDRTQKIF